MLLPHFVRGQEQCENGGGRHGLIVPNSPFDLSARKATPELELRILSTVN